MVFREYTVRCNKNFELKGIPNLSSNIREQILICLAKNEKNPLRYPLRFKVVFHDEMYGLLAKLILWRQSYKCVVLKHIVILLQKKRKPKEFIF